MGGGYHTFSKKSPVAYLKTVPKGLRAYLSMHLLKRRLFNKRSSRGCVFTTDAPIQGGDYSRKCDG